MLLTHLKRPRTWLFASTFGLALSAMPHHLSGQTISPIGITSAYAEDVLGQEVGKKLQKAQTALAARNFTQAMDAVNAADSTHGKTNYEGYVIAQMRAAVAAQSGNASEAIKAYDILINNSRTPAASKKQMLMAEASMAYTAHDYATGARAAERYLHEAGPDQQMQTLLLQCYYLQQNWQATVTAGHSIIAASTASHQAPLESQLQMIATASENMHNSEDKMTAYVQLVKYYPKPQYWQILIHNLVTDTSLSPRIVFNVQRLRLATGLLTSPSDFQDMAERAVQMGLPQLGLKLFDEGYSRHILGTGPSAPAQAHFRSFLAQQAANAHDTVAATAQQANKDATAGPSLTAGYNLLLNGQAPQGKELIQQGLAKKPRNPDLAQLEEGMALMDGGQTSDALSIFNSMNGNDTINNLAQLWAVYLSSQSTK